MPDKPSVLFVCVHNAGCSQMAAAYLTHLAGDAVDVRSAGSALAAEVNPAVVQAMAEGAGQIDRSRRAHITADIIISSRRVRRRQAA